MAFADCCFSFLSSTVKFRYSVSCLRRLVTSTSSSHASVNVLSPKAGTNYEEKLVDISDKSNAEKDSVLPGRLKDEKFSLYANGTNGRGDTRYTQSTGFKSFGMHRKDKEFKLDSREQQVEPGNLQDATSLNAVVKDL